LVEKDVPQARAHLLAEKYRRSSRIEKQIEFQQTDLDVLDGARAILTLLDTHFGRWTYDRAADRLEFQDPSLLASYRAHVARVEAAAHKQQEMQKAIVEASRRARNPAPAQAAQ
jgi:hypothetical protein